MVQTVQTQAFPLNTRGGPAARGSADDTDPTPPARPIVQSHELGLAPEPSADLLDDTDDDAAGWILSYGDLVTLLLLFFVMMFSVSHVNEEALEDVKDALKTGKAAVASKLAGRKEQTVASKIASETVGGVSLHELAVEAKQDNISEHAELLRAVEALLGRVSDAKNLDSVAMNKKLQELKKQFSKDAEKMGLVDAEPTQAFEVSFSANQIFAGDSLDLSEQGKGLVASLAERLKRQSVPYLYAEIQAYDERQVSPLRSPLVPGIEDFTALRASAIARALFAHGVSQRFVKFAGMGSGSPLGSPSAARNRRIVFSLQKFGRSTAAPAGHTDQGAPEK